MKAKDIQTMLLETGLPVAYDHFKEPVKAPYIVWLMPESDNFAADNKSYAGIEIVHAELYTAKKDTVTEALLTDVLESHGIFWKKNSQYLDDEKLFFNDYKFEVIYDGE